MDTDAIMAVADILFAADAPESFPTDSFRSALPQFAEGEIDEVLTKLRDSKLIRSGFDYTRVFPRVEGKEASQDGSLLAVCFGDEYIFAQSRDAVVHVIVESDAVEHGATGFFCVDYPGMIVTADHVVGGRNVVRIEDHRGGVVSTSPMEIVFGVDGIDIALIRCALPDSTKPLKIEWRQEKTLAPFDVLVMGYPPIAGHRPALYQARGAVTSNPQDYYLNSKLGLSDVTHGGCSGGPVISKRGFVVGVIEQENTLEQGGRTHVFRTATPAYYAGRLIGHSGK
jgi:S1-C subfamily serine protease